jgi:LPXTG-motif cell wall-anchored protein
MKDLDFEVLVKDSTVTTKKTNPKVTLTAAIIAGIIILLLFIVFIGKKKSKK